MNKEKVRPYERAGREYENIEIIEVGGVRRVRCKKTGEVVPMSDGVRKARGFR